VRALAFADYGYEVHAWGTLQTGRVADPGAALPLPPAHRLAGRGLGALYYWLFPATMVNVYPWGLSCNQLEPLGPARTRVRYLSAVAWPERRERGAGAGLGQVELEDQQVVVGTQQGVRSRFYGGGRYAPHHEAGLRHFHALVQRLLATGAG